MNALVARKAKLKLALRSPSCGRAGAGAAKAGQPIGQQRRDLAPTLLRRHPVRGDMVDLVHWYRSSLSNSLEAKLSGWTGTNAMREFRARAGCCGVLRKPMLDQADK